YEAVMAFFEIDQAPVELEKRNRIRTEAQRPPASVARATRRADELRQCTDFEQFLKLAPSAKSRNKPSQSNEAIAGQFSVGSAACRLRRPATRSECEPSNVARL